MLTTFFYFMILLLRGDTMKEDVKFCSPKVHLPERARPIHLHPLAARMLWHQLVLPSLLPHLYFCEQKAINQCAIIGIIAGWLLSHEKNEVVYTTVLSARTLFWKRQLPSFEICCPVSRRICLFLSARRSTSRWFASSWLTFASTSSMTDLFRE